MLHRELSAVEVEYLFMSNFLGNINRFDVEWNQEHTADSNRDYGYIIQLINGLNLASKPNYRSGRYRE